MLLSTPLQVGSLALTNRIVLPPMATHKATNGRISDEHISYYCDRAKAGTGLIILEHSYIAKNGKADPNQTSFAEDADIEALQKLTHTIHTQSKAKIVAQINHAGSQTGSAVTGCPLVSASAIVHPNLRSKDGEQATELSTSDIANLVSAFAAAAKRVVETGFDGVEIHCAHGYLLNQFYSPLTNKRTDQYGAQSVENRLRFCTETVAAVREAVGKDFPVFVRLGGCDYQEGGSTIGDSVEASLLLEKAGITLLDISGGVCLYFRKDHKEAGYFSDMTDAIKKKVSIPVLLTGGVKTGSEAEELLQRGVCDLVGVGRAMMKDAAWSQKALQA